MQTLCIVALGFLSLPWASAFQVCPPTEDFDSGVAGEPITRKFPGMHIVGQPRPATLYDCANPTGNDVADLGTQPQEGLVLILNHQKRLRRIPNSFDEGGTLTITWDEPTSIASMGFLDIEEFGYVMALDAGDSEVFYQQIPTAGHGELSRMNIGTDNIKKVMIQLGGNGAITDIEYCNDGPTVTGDPHFKTWGHKWIDYHGQCDLVMLHADDFDGMGHDLDIHVRTTISYGFSFIETAAVKIGDDILEIAGNGWYAVNGVETPYLGGHAGHLANNLYPVYQSKQDSTREKFDIVLNEHQNITLSSFKDLVSVALTGGMNSSNYYGDSVGIMGSFQGELLARDGNTRIHEPNALGQEWQVTDEEPKLFMSDRAPQYPAKCILPTPETAGLRRLGGRDQLEAGVKACAGVTGYKHNDCVQEVKATGDVSVADKYRM